MAKKILFPTDYSEASNEALRYAVSIARQSVASLLVAHVEQPAKTPLGTTVPPPDNLAEEEAALVSLLSTISNAQETPVPHEFRTLHGDAAKEIVRLAADEHVDMIVMATSGRSGLGRLMMGSVAEAVVRSASCPVLSLKVPLSNAAAIREATSHAAEYLNRPDQSDLADFRGDSTDPTEKGRPSALVLLRRAIEARATDVHLDPLGDGMEMRLRIDGRLEHYCRLRHEIAHPLATQLKLMANIDIADPFHPQEGRISLPAPIDGFDVRVTRIPVMGGESIALRLLNGRRLLRPLNSLGLSAESLARLHEMLELGEGVVLVTGPAGSGKTTTAYSMAHGIDDGHRNIVTIEDPPEYCVASFRQMCVDARHEVTMTSGLRNLLRMDPDVVLVGEIRDAETAEIAMRAASSGKYVFTTLHTRDVASTITALRDLHIDNRSLAGNLTGIISQRLVRRACPDCGEQVSLDPLLAPLFRGEGLEPPTTVPSPRGCSTCRGLGYYDRVGIFEVALPNSAIRGAIERGDSEEELRHMIRSNGTRSLLADGLAKVCEGITTLDEVRSMTWVRFPT